MAQTKNKRFKEQKRAQKNPAPQPVTKTKKSPPAQNNGGKKLLIGGGIAVALAAAATAVVLVVNPFGGAATDASKGSGASAATPRPTPTAMSDSLVRMSLIRDYRASVESETLEKITASCKTGKPVSATARVRGEETPITVTCKGVELTVINSETKKPLEGRKAPAS